jgi:hypothetical protein
VTAQERVFSSGHLSPSARYRIVVAGEIGAKEIEGMIQFLQLQKSFLEERKGFFEQLTPEQQRAALEYDGPEDHGDPAYRRS